MIHANHFITISNILEFSYTYRQAASTFFRYQLPMLFVFLIDILSIFQSMTTAKKISIFQDDKE